MYRIRTLNPISEKGLSLFGDHYTISDTEPNPCAILVRSQIMHEMDIPDSLLAVGRAGAGTNNIPIDRFTSIGVPVFNTPGANANAVKELVLTGLLLAARNICAAWEYLRQLQGSDQELHALVEQNKGLFVGTELPGKTLGVIGLGSVGVLVANSACDLGMKVVGYDPAMTVKNAWKLQSNVEQADSLDQVMRQADFVTLHVPLLKQTKHLIDAQLISKMRAGAVLLNFARSEIVDAQAVLGAIASEQLHYYVCDFPHNELRSHSQVICLPHLGASTVEAQQNCAVMVVQQIRDYLKYGHIRNAVNFPDVKLSPSKGARLAIVNANVPNMVAQISSVLSQHQLNIVDMINKSKQDTAYTLIDVDHSVAPGVLEVLRAIEGVVRVRHLA